MANIIYNIKRFFLLAIVAAFGLYLLVGQISYWRMSEEEQIRDALTQMTEAVKSRDAGGILDHISEAYKDDFNFDLEKLRRGITYFCLYYHAVDANTEILSIKKDESGFWLVDVKATLMAGRDKDQKPTENILNRFTRNVPLRLKFIENDGVWRIIHTSTAPVDE